MVEEQSIVARTVREALRKALDPKSALSSAEIEPLLSIPSTTQRVARHHVVTKDNADYIFLVLTGCVYEARFFPDGRRQILDWFVEGDLTGAGPVALGEELVAGETAEVARFDRAPFEDAVLQSVGLLRCALSVAARSHMRLRDRTISLGRKSALERLATFIVEVFERRAGKLAAGATATMPFRQGEIADVLGLTSVHINRMFRELRDQNIIVTGGDTITAIDPSALRSIARGRGPRPLPAASR